MPVELQGQASHQKRDIGHSHGQPEKLAKIEIAARQHRQAPSASSGPRTRHAISRVCWQKEQIAWSLEKC
jgi:hypothetical protein